MNLAKLVHHSLNTRVSPMVYIMMSVSVFIGFCFATGLIVGPTESVLYSAGVLVDPRIWGGVLCCTASGAIIGFIRRNKSLVLLGGGTGLLLWLFASIATALTGAWYVFFTVALFHLLFHGYVYLACSLGYLERTPTSSDL